MSADKVLSYKEFCEQYYPHMLSDAYREEMMEKHNIDANEEYEAMTRLQYNMYLDGML